MVAVGRAGARDPRRQARHHADTAAAAWSRSGTGWPPRSRAAGGALTAAAANRMFDYAALVAALVVFGAHARPRRCCWPTPWPRPSRSCRSPQGLGFVESGLTTLLVLIGISADQAVVGTLLYRLVSFWLPIPIGALAWAGWRINLHRTGPPSAPTPSGG